MYLRNLEKYDHSSVSKNRQKLLRIIMFVLFVLGGSVFSSLTGQEIEILQHQNSNTFSKSVINNVETENTMTQSIIKQIKEQEEN